MASPPLTPVRQYFSHNTSPSSHRLSTASRYSNGSQDLPTPLDAATGGQGLGNLADELEFADEEDEEWDYDAEAETEAGVEAGMEVKVEASAGAGAGAGAGADQVEKRSVEAVVVDDDPRDSGVHVKLPHRNFSRPMSRDQEADEDTQSVFSRELEDCMTQIKRLANPQLHQNPDTLSRTLHALQSLTPQQSLEARTQRLTTSTNSLSSHLIHQTKHFASISAALFSPFAFVQPLDPQVIDEHILPAISHVLQDLPTPDARPLHALSRLDRETADLLQTLAALSDSLQMGRQTTASAARHLRNTHTMVSEMRRESDLAEQAMSRLEKDGWDRRLAERDCARECKDVVGGFEQVCEGLRKGLEEKIAA